MRHVARMIQPALPGPAPGPVSGLAVSPAPAPGFAASPIPSNPVHIGGPPEFSGPSWGGQARAGQAQVFSGRPTAAPGCRLYAYNPCSHGLHPGDPVDWGRFCIKAARDAGNLPAPWLGRSAVVSTWLWEAKPPSFVLDLGSGCLDLARVLPAETKYVPADSQRVDQLKDSPYYNDIITCNFNGGMMPLLPPNISRDMDGVIVALGVIEYVCDPKAFVKGLLDYKRSIIMSYAPAEQPMEPGTQMGVRSNGLTLLQWKDLLEEVGFPSIPWRQARVLSGGFINHVYYYKADVVSRARPKAAPSPAPAVSPAAPQTAPQAAPQASPRAPPPSPGVAVPAPSPQVVLCGGPAPAAAKEDDCCGDVHYQEEGDTHYHAEGDIHIYGDCEKKKPKPKPKLRAKAPCPCPPPSPARAMPPAPSPPPPMPMPAPAPAPAPVACPPEAYAPCPPPLEEKKDPQWWVMPPPPALQPEVFESLEPLPTDAPPILTVDTKTYN